MSTPGRPATPRDNPYFGLDYYDDAYGEWFFGREAERHKIIANLQATRLTLLHAESGVGKSSLLRAGVAWNMRRVADERFGRHRPIRSLPIVFNSWKDDPVRDLAEAAGNAVAPYLNGGESPELASDRLDLAIEKATDALNVSLFIMLDQFEEYFLYQSREPEPGRFADELARCVNRTDLRANFLIAIREDAYAGLGDLFKGRIGNVYGNYLHVDYLGRQAAEEAIRGPLDVWNHQREPAERVTPHDDLVRTVLDEVRTFDERGAARGGAPAANGEGDRIATPLLQLVMDRVWNQERAEGSRELRLATLQGLHGVRMIAETHLSGALNSLAAPERQIALDVFDHLVTPSGTKIAESVSDLARRTGRSEEQVGGALAKLDRERIVRPIPAPPGQDPIRFRRYEIFHDVLAPTINRAIAAREELRRTRRIRRFAALAVALFVVACGIAAGFACLQATADSEKAIAQSRQVAAEADQVMGQDPELGLNLALRALSLGGTSEAERALRAALPNVQTIRTLNDGAYVSAAVFDPADSDEVAEADFSGDAWIWNVKTGRRLTHLWFGGMSVTGGAGSVAFNPSGSEVAIGYGGGNVVVFDARSGKELQSTIVTSNTVHYTPVVSVAFVGATGEIAIATRETTVLWDSAKGPACCTVLYAHPSAAIAAEPGHPHVFALATDHGIVIVDTRAAGNARVRQLSTQNAYDVGFSPSGSEVVAANPFGNVEIYNVATGQATGLSAIYPDPYTAAFSPDGKHIVSGYDDGTTIVWDVATGLPVTVLAGNAGAVDTARFSADGREVVTAGADGSVRVWYAEPRELRTDFTSAPGGGTSGYVAWASFIGDQVLTIDQDNRIRVLTAAGQPEAGLNPGTGPDQGLAWNESGTRVYFSSLDGSVDVWQRAGQSYVPVKFSTPVDISEATGDMDVSADGSLIAVGSDDGYSVQVLSGASGTPLRTLNATNDINDLAVSPNGEQIVGADVDGQAEVWNGTATSPIMLGPTGSQLLDVAFDRSGSEFVTAGQNGTVNVWDARGDRLVSSIDVCPSPNSAEISPDATKVLVACADGTVRVFEIAGGKELVALPAALDGYVVDADFSPDGKTIVAAIDAGDAGCVQIWSAELATDSLPALRQLANQRVTEQLTPAQENEYVPGG